MTLSRRSFVTLVGSLLAYFATRRTHATPSNTTQEEKMDITRVGSQPSTKGPSEWFSGTVRIDPLFPAKAPARAAGNTVTFEPGGRTAWREARSRRYDLVTSSGSRRARIIGTGRLLRRR